MKGLKSDKTLLTEANEQLQNQDKEKPESNSKEKFRFPKILMI